MRIDLEMVMHDSETAPSNFISCKVIHEDDRDDVAIGSAIASVVRGTQTARQLVAIANAINELSDGGDDRVIHESEIELAEAAKRLIQYWKDSDQQIDEIMKKKLDQLR